MEGERPKVCSTCKHWGISPEAEAKVSEEEPLNGHVCALAGKINKAMQVVPHWADGLLKTGPWHTCGAYETGEF